MKTQMHAPRASARMPMIPPPAGMAPPTGMAPAGPMAAPASPIAGMNKGGMSSPHHRADGAAKRGHTECKMCGGGMYKK
jgi:hypothetical protein